MSTMFKSEAARDVITAAYERFRANVPGDTRSQTVATRHGETHVLVAGQRDAPPLVLVHGALASSAHATAELGPLLDRHCVYAPDVIGQSVKSVDTRIALDGPAYGEWLLDVLDGLGLTRPVIYGVSWGGFVSLKLATLAPTRIDKLVLLVPAGIVSGSAWQGLTKVALPLALYRMFPSDDRLRRFVGAIASEPDERWLRYFAEAFASYNLDMRAPPLFAPEALAAFDRPTLVFAAAEDLSFPGSALLDRIRTLLPHAETELLANVRHSPPTDDAFRGRMAERISSFLSGGPAAAAAQ